MTRRWQCFLVLLVGVFFTIGSIGCSGGRTVSGTPISREFLDDTTDTTGECVYDPDLDPFNSSWIPYVETEIGMEGIALEEASITDTLLTCGDDVKEKIKQLEKGIKSLEKQIKAHEKKLADYKKDPDKYDNDGRLKKAKTPAERQKIIDGRIKKLEKEIQKFKDEIAKKKKEIEDLKNSCS